MKERRKHKKNRENKNNRRNNYKRYLILTIALIMVTMITGTIVFRFYINNFTKERDASRYEQYYVMITGERNDSFYEEVYQGVYEAGLERGCYVDLLDKGFASDYTREDMMRIAIASEVDGIIVAADESDEMTRLIDEAAADGIPVVTLYNDNTKSARCSFVGVGSYDLGREYGRQVLKIAQQLDTALLVKTEDQPGTVVLDEDGALSLSVMILVNANAQDSGQNILCSGIQETLESEKPEGMEIELTLMSVDDTNAFSVEESIRDIFRAGNFPDIMVCLNELNTNCVYQAVVDYNKVGEVNILGYYDSDTILRAIDRNVIYATISVDTEQMGKFCVEALTEYHDFGNASQYFMADIVLINKDNVEQYLTREGGEDEK